MPTTPALTPKQRRHLGIPARVPTERATRHLTALREAGLTDQQIATTAGLSLRIINRIAAHHPRINASTEHRLLAVTIPATPSPANSTALLPPHGTRRRLQALVHAGWPPHRIATDAGIHPDLLYRLLHRERDGVTMRTAARTTAVFRRLWDQQPEEHGVRPVAARRARMLAARHGFAPALAWDNIDAAESVPDIGVEVSRVRAVVEDTAELVREGLSREGIATRLGIGWDAVRQAHRRAGVPVPVVWE